MAVSFFSMMSFVSRYIMTAESSMQSTWKYCMYEPMEWSSWSAILVMSRIVIVVAILLSSISFIFVSDKNPLNLPSAKSKVSAKCSIGINTAMLWDLS